MSSQQPYPHPNTTGHPSPRQTPPGRPGYVSDDERVASTVAHLSAPIAAIVSAGWISFAGPLIVWFIYRNRSAAVRQAAAGAFNFNIAFSAMYIIGWILLFTLIGAPFAFLLWGVIFLVAAWCHVRGALRSMRGQSYDYPFQIKILS